MAQTENKSPQTCQSCYKIIEKDEQCFVNSELFCMACSSYKLVNNKVPKVFNSKINTFLLIVGITNIASWIEELSDIKYSGSFALIFVLLPIFGYFEFKHQEKIRTSIELRDIQINVLENALKNRQNHIAIPNNIK